MFLQEQAGTVAAPLGSAEEVQGIPWNRGRAPYVCRCVCVWGCICVYMNVYVHMCMCVCTSMCACEYVCTSVCVSAHVSVYQIPMLSGHVVQKEPAVLAAAWGPSRPSLFALLLGFLQVSVQMWHPWGVPPPPGPEEAGPAPCPHPPVFGGVSWRLWAVGREGLTLFHALLCPQL